VTADICRQHGIIQVSDPDELVATFLLFSGSAPPAGPRAAVMTLSGGYATLTADLREPAGLELPRLAPATLERLAPLIDGRPGNPFDAWGSGDFRRSLAVGAAALLVDTATDFLVLFQDLPPENAVNGVDVPEAAIELIGELGPTDKPLVLLGSLGDRPAGSRLERLASLGVPYLAGAGSGIRALGSWAGYRRRLDSLESRLASRTESAQRQPSGSAQPSLSRLPLVDEGLARSPEEAAEYAERIGYPVVLKVQSPDIPHRTEARAVALAVEREQLEEAYTTILRRAASAVPGASIEGVAVQRQMPPGLEMIVGASRDPEWGWVVMCGLGGVSVEIFRDVVFRRVPLTPGDVRAMLEQLRSYPLLVGFRGQPSRDLDALSALILELAELAQREGESLRQVEFNPVIVYERGGGVAVVDRLVVTG
jgi:acyl-CoA synthetase (NDP forming)